jgi:3-phosphoshikimate 1-carboxyvinyltransferase
MNYNVFPSTLNSSEIRVPGDKSISHRALIFGAIANGMSSFTGFLPSNDCLATLRAFQNMGLVISHDNTNLRVHGLGLKGLKNSSMPHDLGNSGTAVRLLAGLLAAQDFDSTLLGDESLSIRPMNRIIEPLSLMGAKISSQAGCLPLEITGQQNISDINYDMPLASAQVKSSIILAALYSDEQTIITECGITRDHSERMLMSMSGPIETKKSKVLIGASKSLEPIEMQIPGDFSSASFLIAAFLINKNSASLILKDVGINPTRIGFLSIIKLMGAKIELKNIGVFGNEPTADIHVQSSNLVGINIDDPDLISLAIDEFPIIFILGAYAQGLTKISGIDELRFKESDRIKSMTVGMKCLGVSINDTDQGVIIENSEFQGGIVDSFGDHRIAMSFVIAAIAATKEITVKNIDNINTSFPGFKDLMEQIGVNISLHNDNSSTTDAPK